MKSTIIIDDSKNVPSVSEILKIINRKSLACQGRVSTCPRSFRHLLVELGKMSMLHSCYYGHHTMVYDHTISP